MSAVMTFFKSIQLDRDKKRSDFLCAGEWRKLSKPSSIIESL